MSSWHFTYEPSRGPDGPATMTVYAPQVDPDNPPTWGQPEKVLPLVVAEFVALLGEECLSADPADYFTVHRPDGSLAVHLREP